MSERRQVDCLICERYITSQQWFPWCCQVCRDSAVAETRRASERTT